MHYRKLGKTDLNVSEIGFGAWAIGGTYEVGGNLFAGWGKVADRESIKAIHKAFDCGINFIDTSNAYGNGHSEEVIGKALHASRHKWVIATKGGRIFRGNKKITDHSAKTIMENVDQSLKRLKTDYIDVYQLHNPERDSLKDDDVWELLDKLKENGKIRYYGISIKGSYQDDLNFGIELVQKYEMDTVQVVYNMLDQKADNVLFPLVQKKDIGLIARVPLASGFLADKWNLKTEFPADDSRNRFNKGRSEREEFINNLKNVEQLRFLKNESTKTMAIAALKFVISSNAVSVVIVGIKTEKQAEENAKASDGKLLNQSNLEKIKHLYENNFYL